MTITNIIGITISHTITSSTSITSITSIITTTITSTITFTFTLTAAKVDTLSANCHACNYKASDSYENTAYD